MIFKHLQTVFSLYESNVRQGVQAVTSSHASSSAADWSGFGPSARNDKPGSYTLKYVSLIIIYTKEKVKKVFTRKKLLNKCFHGRECK